MGFLCIDGRDFRASDTLSRRRDRQPGVREAISSTARIRSGKSFESGAGRRAYALSDRGLRPRRPLPDDMREPILPTAYVPFHSIDAKGALQPMGRGTFVVRTASANPLALASTLRQEVPRARPEFRVSNIRTQAEINQSHTVRERLLAMLALFFAVVALLLAGDRTVRRARLLACCNGGARSAFAWRSARRPATSRGGDGGGFSLGAGGSAARGLRWPGVGAIPSRRCSTR